MGSGYIRRSLSLRAHKAGLHSPDQPALFLEATENPWYDFFLFFHWKNNNRGVARPSPIDVTDGILRLAPDKWCLWSYQAYTKLIPRELSVENALSPLFLNGILCVISTNTRIFAKICTTALLSGSIHPQIAACSLHGISLGYQARPRAKEDRTSLFCSAKMFYRGLSSHDEPWQHVPRARYLHTTCMMVTTKTRSTLVFSAWNVLEHDF